MMPAKGSSSPAKLTVWYLLGGLMMACAIAAAWLQMKYQLPPLAKFKALPDFQLTERSGRVIRLADLKGKVWLADFIYTTCPGTCPMLSSRLTELQNKVLKNPDTLLVSISINPEHDTPKVLKQYAEKFHASPDRWLFFTGEKSKVRDLINTGFMLAAGEVADPNQEIVHSTKLVLVDRAGNIRAYYDGLSTGTDDRIQRDIGRLLREK